MAKTINLKEKSLDALGVEAPPKKRGRPPKKSNVYKIFRNLTDRRITLFNHVIEAKQEKKFIMETGLFLEKTPQMRAYLHSKILEVV